MFYREKKIDCGSYREADIIPRTDSAEKAAKGRRGKSKKVSEPKQKDLNEKNSKRYLVQLGNGNFGAGDLHVTFTYSEKYLPRTEAEAEQNRIRVTAEDVQPDGSRGSGLPREAYSFDGGKTWTAEREYTVKENGTVEIAVRDICGNVSRESITVSNIRKEEPDGGGTGDGGDDGKKEEDGKREQH